ncbi:hypothetical protein BASA81_003805 [Batrachochytrium salamandrivorans]|nr:hypothetical protein BASA81_003805 [Batrachochytrium salamandrivorans]
MADNCGYEVCGLAILFGIHVQSQGFVRGCEWADLLPRKLEICVVVMLALYATSLLGRGSKTLVTLPQLFDCDVNLTLFDKLTIPNELELAHSRAGLCKAIVPGSSLADSLAAMELCLGNTSSVDLYPTFGVHPYHASAHNKQCPKEFAVQLRQAFSSDPICRPVAIGECGLDASPGFPPLNEQMEWFALQLDLACELNAPLFLHERGAHELFMGELDKRRGRLPNKLLVHCFTGTEQELRTYLDWGMLISISGLICRPDKQGKTLFNTLRRVDPPRNRLMIETDAPYMQFPGCRTLCDTNKLASKPNPPSAIAQVAETLSLCLNRDYREVCEDLYQTTTRFFLERKGN